MRNTGRIANKYSIEIPYYNYRDVEFLEDIKKAHDQLETISTNVKSVLKRRVEDEFLGQEIDSKTRANITEFCSYLLSISKFYGFPILTSGFVTALHKDVLSIKAYSNKVSSLLEATFTYFNHNGDYQMTANGLISSDLSTTPDRSQIMKANNDVLPGFSSDNELCEEYYIHIEVPGQIPVLVLPIK